MRSSEHASSRTASTALTRQRILASARALIGSRGGAQVSLEDIAAASEITRPGLLGHFRSMDALMTAVEAEFCAESGRQMTLGVSSWANLLEIPDYRSMSVQFLSLAMTADSPSPSTACHHRQLLESAESILTEHSDSTALTPQGLVATWEGLLVLQSYFPSLDPARIIQARLDPARARPSAPSSRTAPVSPASLIPAEFGYARGRSRRQQIVEDATLLFARNGYHGTTIRQLASEVGISASTLLHHFGHKAGLLAEVLRHRDEQLVHRRGQRDMDARTELAELGDEARRDLEVERGLVDMYAVLSTEAIHPDHPAHAYFTDRFSRTIDYFEGLIANSDSGSPDPRLDAVWLVALWDGLQYQLILSPDDMDLPAQLDHHIQTSLGITPATRSAIPDEPHTLDERTSSQV
ncbi:TetR/AcrR family transcriptional regulator [Microbacterium hydrocarbonoxydans]|uniref:TetR/AcrR family transcriptional regulator n=1 Tax=Microbacterium hydrocarbonoxydans TaxID=273678 RepID=UPI003D98C2DC